MKKKNVGKKIFTALLILIAFLLVAAFFVITKTLDFDEDPSVKQGETLADVTEADNVVVEHLNSLRDESSLSGVLKSWAAVTTDSNLMRSNNVINILLVGVDAGGGNSDVMMLFSVNRATKKIYLTSVMRDSYTFINASTGETYGKLNAAYSYGGINLLIKTFQDNFKIKIDHYATVNFNSFAEIVDILGGINLDIEQYEAKEIDATIRREYSAVYENCPYGENVTLDGLHALVFCRIRHCYNDADVHRTLNQRKFVSAIIEKSKSVSLMQAGSAIGSVLKYIKTDLAADEIMKYITKGLTEKCYNYEIISSCYPEEDERMDYSGNAWVWIVDYPAAAQKMQTLIYGKSNITLSEDRVSAIDIMQNSRELGEAHP